MSRMTHRRFVTGDPGIASSSSWNSDETIIPRRREDVRVYSIDGDAVLYDGKLKKMYLLNHTALAVWNRCDGRTTIRRAAADMTRDYDTPRETALDHTEEVVALLSSLNLLDHEVA